MPPAAAGYSAGMKRPLAAVAPSCDVDGRNAAAAAAAKRRERRRRLSGRARRRCGDGRSGPVRGAHRRPAHTRRPLAAAAARRKEADDQAAAAPPAEPAWIRKILLERLGLTYDQPVVFIARKTVTRTDLDPHQNRFRLPIFGVERRLLPMLTVDEAKEANLVENDEEKGVPRPRPRPKKKRRTEKGSVVVAATAAADGELQKPQGTTTPETNVEGEDQAPPRPKPVPKKKKRRTEKGSVDVADGEQQQQQKGREKEPRKKAQGKDHGGVPVTVLHLSGAMKELRLVLWDSSHGTIIKGTGYMDFIAGTGLREHDAVQIWAFKRRGFRLFGATVPESRFYLVIVGGSWRPLEAPPPQCMLPPSHAPVEVCA